MSTADSSINDQRESLQVVKICGSSLHTICASIPKTNFHQTFCETTGRMPMQHSPPASRSRAAAARPNAGGDQPEEPAHGEQLIDQPEPEKPLINEDEHQAPVQETRVAEGNPIAAQQQGAAALSQSPNPQVTVQQQGAAAQVQATNDIPEHPSSASISPKQGESDVVVRKMQALVVQNLKEPPRFNSKTDPEDWLRGFKRVENFNGRTPTQMLAGAPFCFSGETLDWFDNESDQFDCWETFEREFRTRFVDSTKISEEAREKLRQLVYERGTSFTRHLEIVLKLCGKLDAKMSREEIIRKFVQTFDEEQAMTFVGKALQSLADLRAHVSYLDRTIPFVNRKTSQPSSINAVSRPRSPVRPQIGDSRSAAIHGAAPDQRSSAVSAQRHSSPIIEGEALCNWCNRVGHTFRICLNRQRGYPAAPSQQVAPQQLNENQGN